MKTFLTLFVLFFSSSVVAEDISDFEIEGMSIGDSLLDYFSKTEIQETFYPNSTKFARTGHMINNGTYEEVRVHYKTNNKFVEKKSSKNFIIYGIGGLIHYPNNIDACYAKEKEIIKSLETDFPNSEKYVQGITSHRGDPTGESTYSYTSFSIEGGAIIIECTDWSDSATSTKGYVDYLGVMINSNEFIEWLQNEAF